MERYIAKNKDALIAAADLTMRLEDNVKAGLAALGLQSRALPSQFDASEYYTELPITSPLVVEFRAECMPSDQDIEEQLAQHLRRIVSAQHGTGAVLLAYTGIAWSAKKRWMTYQQCRTIFRRMHVWSRGLRQRLSR